MNGSRIQHACHPEERSDEGSRAWFLRFLPSLRSGSE